VPEDTLRGVIVSSSSRRSVTVTLGKKPQHHIYRPVARGRAIAKISSVAAPLPIRFKTAAAVMVKFQLEMGIEPNSNRTNRTRTHILGRTEPN